MREIRDERSFLDDSCTLPEPFMVTFFLQGLGIAYEQAENKLFTGRSLFDEKVLEDRPPLKGVTFEDAVRVALEREVQLQGRNEETALIARSTDGVPVSK